MMTETSFRGVKEAQSIYRMNNTPNTLFSSTASRRERAPDSERETKADTSLSPLEIDMISLLFSLGVSVTHFFVFRLFTSPWFSCALFNFSFLLYSQLPLLSFLSFFGCGQSAFPYISIHNEWVTVPRAANFLPSFFIKHLSLSPHAGLIPAVYNTMLVRLGSRWRRQLLRNYLGNYANSELRGGKSAPSASCSRERGERDALPVCVLPPGHGPTKMCLIRAERDTLLCSNSQVIS